MAVPPSEQLVATNLRPLGIEWEWLQAKDGYWFWYIKDRERSRTWVPESLVRDDLTMSQLLAMMQDSIDGFDHSLTGRDLMLETLIKLYTTAMRHDVRSPIPHLAGPPGTNKSGVCAQLAETVGRKLHVINVSRLTPLEIEGIQMPVERNTKLKMLINRMWSELEEGDVVLFDEFLRGYPEVYNGLLDIFTSRHVAGFDLPKVFIVAASNSITTYDPALEDRLLHLFVPDIRSKTNARYQVQSLLCKQAGLLPDMAKAQEMVELFSKQVEPTYAVLDQFQHKASPGTTVGGKSVRNLVGQILLRQVETPELLELVNENNRQAKDQGKLQYLILLTGKGVDDATHVKLKKLVGNDKLTDLQAANLDLNLQLIEMEAVRKEGSQVKKEETDDGIVLD